METAKEKYRVDGAIPTWAEGAYDFTFRRGIDARLPFIKTDEILTRMRFVSMVINMLDAAASSDELEAFPAPEEGYFADLNIRYRNPDAKANRAAGYGIVEGTIGADRLRYFNGEDLLTREQAAKMLVSLLDFCSDKLGYSLEPAEAPATYADQDRISAWAKPFTGTVAAYGLMQGDDRGNFNPQGQLDFSSSVVMLARTLKLLDGAVEAKTGFIPL